MRFASDMLQERVGRYQEHTRGGCKASWKEVWDQECRPGTAGALRPRKHKMGRSWQVTAGRIRKDAAAP